MINQVKKSFLASIWFMFLTFPIVVAKVDTVEETMDFRWINMLYVGAAAFILSFVWRYFRNKKPSDNEVALRVHQLVENVNAHTGAKLTLAILLALGLLVFPLIFSTYQVNIMTQAFMYVMLGLGLNVVVGLAGLLDLGYVAFFAVGAYGYALLNLHFGLGFWAVLPVAGVMAALMGLLLGFPVLRLRGDYLAIVTLGFGEIIRLVLENWTDFSKGPSGISGIPRPGFFGIDLTIESHFKYMYYIVLSLVVLTIFVVGRLKDSRLGRAWIALREDEIACESMGINRTQTKLTAFALGAMWAGLAGVIFAAKTTFINPASFTFMESAIILSIVVLGGMGSSLGVIMGAFLLILLPEYLRAFSEYRMLLFGGIMVLIMVFRPQGLIPNPRKTYKYTPKDAGAME